MGGGCRCYWVDTSLQLYKMLKTDEYNIKTTKIQTGNKLARLSSTAWVN